MNKVLADKMYRNLAYNKMIDYWFLKWNHKLAMCTTLSGCEMCVRNVHFQLMLESVT